MDVVDRHLKTEDKGLEDYFLGFQWVVLKILILKCHVGIVEYTEIPKCLFVKVPKVAQNLAILVGEIKIFVSAGYCIAFLLLVSPPLSSLDLS